MSLADKIEATEKFLKECLTKYGNPVLLCSFGKDSMVLLHLLYCRNIRIPLIYFRDPWFPRKNDFANKVISSWNLEVHDYPPAKVSLCTGKDMVALVSEYQSSAHSTIFVLKNTIEYQEGEDEDKFLCGVNFLIRPCSVFVFPWDLGFVAHKNVDEDVIFGPIPLHSNLLYRDQGPDYAFPLRDWTHDDVWDYTEKFNVPFQSDRYDIAHRCEWSDKEFNSDWYPVCIRCVDKRHEGETVFCPKLKIELKNSGKAVPEYGWQSDYFRYSKERLHHG